MSSRIILLMPDCDRQLGTNKLAVQQMLDIAEAHDVGGTLPEPFIKVTPNITGHGETWYHPQGLFVIRTDHHPVLLTSERCGTCGIKHMDVAHTYLFASWADFESRTYMRYVGTQIEVAGLASPIGGA